MSVTLCLGCSHAPHAPNACPTIPAFQRGPRPCRCPFNATQTYTKRTWDDMKLGRPLFEDHAMDPRD